MQRTGVKENQRTYSREVAASLARQLLEEVDSLSYEPTSGTYANCLNATGVRKSLRGLERREPARSPGTTRRRRRLHATVEHPERRHRRSDHRELQDHPRARAVERPRPDPRSSSSPRTRPGPSPLRHERCSTRSPPIDQRFHAGRAPGSDPDLGHRVCYGHPADDGFDARLHAGNREREDRAGLGGGEEHLPRRHVDRRIPARHPRRRSSR